MDRLYKTGKWTVAAAEELSDYIHELDLPADVNFDLFIKVKARVKEAADFAYWMGFVQGCKYAKQNDKGWPFGGD